MPLKNLWLFNTYPEPSGHFYPHQTTYNEGSHIPAWKQNFKFQLKIAGIVNIEEIIISSYFIFFWIKPLSFTKSNKQTKKTYGYITEKVDILQEIFNLNIPCQQPMSDNQQTRWKEFSKSALAAPINRSWQGVPSVKTKPSQPSQNQTYILNNTRQAIDSWVHAQASILAYRNLYSVFRYED